MTAPDVELRRTWHRVVGRHHDHAFEHLLARHREPHRRYHTATHVMWVCRHVDELVSGLPAVAPHLTTVLAAALHHDAVYDPRAAHGHNEAASARLAARVLTDAGWSDERVRAVVSLVEATADHTALPGELAAPSTVLLDADLAVLGADPATYQAYVTGVRAEYAHVDDDQWRVGRAAVLDGFLARDRLFLTDAMHATRDGRARANLAAERASLRGAASGQ